MAQPGPPAENPATPLGLTGAFSVNASGAAEYSIPLVVPPGTNGMAPQLNLRYDSQDIGSFLGQGWSLNGLSMVTRGPATKTVDGFVNPLDGDNHDRFYFQGLELVAVADHMGRALVTDTDQSAAYGACGTVYHTELETWTKIVSMCTNCPLGHRCSEGPAYFEVWNKDGSYMRLGKNNSSGIRLPGQTTVFVWAVDRVEDRNGNYINYYYRPDTQGTPLPDKIRYTGHKGGGGFNAIEPQREVRFGYTQQGHQIFHYVAGSQIIQQDLLSSIDTYVDDQQVSHYQIDYDTGTTTQKNLLTTVTRSVKDPVSGKLVAQQPTQFGWTGGVMPCQPENACAGTQGFAYDYPLQNRTGEVGWGSDGHWPGDFNNDGLTDLLYNKEGTPEYYIMYSNGLQLLPPKLWGVRAGESRRGAQSHWVADVNGDGRLDLLYLRKDKFQYWAILNQDNHTKHNAIAWDHIQTENENAKLWLVDINGDRFVDLLQVPDAFVVTQPGATALHEVRLGSATGFEDVSHTAYDQAWDLEKQWAGDLNGDGLSDLLYLTRDAKTFRALINVNGTRLEDRAWSAAQPEAILSDQQKHWLLDFNGDGLLDFVIANTRPDIHDPNHQELLVYFGTGFGFELKAILFEDPTHLAVGELDTVFFGEANGDGLPDLIFGEPTNPSLFGVLLNHNGVALGRHAAWTQVTEPIGYGGAALWPSDVNGDGLTDFLYNRRGTKTYRLSHGKTYEPEMIETIEEGDNGKVIQVGYALMTDANSEVYRPGPQPEAPWREQRLPTYLVSDHAVTEKLSADETRAAEAFRFRHTYQGATYDPESRGWLGFQKSWVFDEASGFETHTFRDLTPALRGRTARVEVRRHSDGVLIQSTHFQYQTPPSPYPKVTRLLTEAVTTVQHSEDGTYATAVAYNYDDYDNITRVWNLGRVALPEAGRPVTDRRDFPADGLTTLNRYDNDPDTWVLGQLVEQKTVNQEYFQPDWRYYQKWESETDLEWQRLDYDPNTGQLVTEKNYDDVNRRWLTTTYNYDRFGNLTGITDPRNNTTTTTYDPIYNTFLETQTSPPNDAGRTLTTTYKSDPSNGNLKQTVDANGVVRINDYDAYGRLIGNSVKVPNGATRKMIAIDYEPQTDGLSITTRSRVKWNDGNQAAWDWEKKYYDRFGRIYRAEKKGPTEARTYTTFWHYDSQGRLFQESQPFQGSETPVYTTRAYDENNHLKSITTPDGTVTSYTHDRARRLTTVSQADPTVRSRWDRDTVDTLAFTNIYGQLRKVQHPDQTTVEYTYDKLGRLHEKIDPKRNKTTYHYNAMGWLIEENHPDAGTTLFEYNANGQMKTRTNADGSQITQTFDKLGRINSKTIATNGDPEIHRFTYDDPAVAWSQGHMTRIAGPEYSEDITYTAYGDVASRTFTIAGQAYTTEYRYNALGNTTKEIYPDQTKLVQDYYDDNLLKSMTLVDTNKQSRQFGTFTYNARQQLTKIVHGNGVTTDRDYDLLGRLSFSWTYKIGSPNLINLVRDTYTWNRAGKLFEINDGTPHALSQAFGYDHRGRLVNAQGDYPTMTYDYDENGNLTKKGDRTFLFGENNQLSPEDPSKPIYNPEGTLQSRRIDNSQDYYFYTYDADHRLRQVKRGSRESDATLVNEFSYDARGTRIRATAADGLVTYTISPHYAVDVYPGGRQVHTKSVVGPNGLAGTVTLNGNQVNLAAIATHSLHHQWASAVLTHPAGIGRAARALFGLVAVKASGFKSAYFPLVLCLPVALAVLYVMLWFQAARRRSVLYRLRLRWQHLLQPLRSSPQPANPALPTRCTDFLRGNRRRWWATPFSLFLVTVQPFAMAEMQPGALGAGRPEPGIRYFHNNHIMSVGLVTDSNGMEVARLAYLPYGALDQGASSGTDNFREKFAGREADNDNGLIYFGDRYYDPGLGRFISPDPERQFDSAYSYTDGDPEGRIDPNGDFAFMLGMIAVGALIGAYSAGAMVNHSFNPADWDWKSSKTWESLLGGALIGAAGGLAGGAFEGLGLGASLLMESVVNIAETAALAKLTGDSTANTLVALSFGVVAGIGFGTVGRFMALQRQSVRKVMGSSFSRGARRGKTQNVRPASDAGPAARRSSGNCFGAQTLIAGEQGYQNITDVKVGDLVWGFNQATGETALYPVVEAFSRTVHVMVQVQADGKTLQTTRNHPFYVVDKGWVRAEVLEPGDRLSRLDGSETVVEDIGFIDGTFTVYNFVVDEAHDYYVQSSTAVGAGEAAPDSILVHNGRCHNGYTDQAHAQQTRQTAVAEGRYDYRLQHGGRNVAVAEIRLPGQGQSRYGSVSGSQPHQFGGELPVVQDPEIISLPQGCMPRQWDTEIKVLNYVIEQTQGTPNVRGMVSMYTELPPCNWCTNGLKTFSYLRPNIRLKVYYGNDLSYYWVYP